MLRTKENYNKIIPQTLQNKHTFLYICSDSARFVNTASLAAGRSKCIYEPEGTPYSTHFETRTSEA
jgi:hypothetical protein